MNQRIIGDALQLNAEINESIFNSKSPRFLKILEKKYYTLKISRIVKKIGAGNVPLTKANLVELASYIYNNYQPDCKFMGIKHVRYFRDSDSYLMRLEFGNSTLVFNLHDANNSKVNNFTCKVIPDNGLGKAYEVEIKEMVTDNNEIRHVLIDANTVLYNIIKDYILLIIGKY